MKNKHKEMVEKGFFAAFEKGAKLFQEGNFAPAEKKFRECLSIDADDYASANLHDAAMFWKKSQLAANAALRMMTKNGFVHKFGEEEADQIAAALVKKFHRKSIAQFGLGRACLAMPSGLDFDIFAKRAFAAALLALGDHKADRYKKSMVHTLFAQVDDREAHLAEAKRLAPKFGEGLGL